MPHQPLALELPPPPRDARLRLRHRALRVLLALLATGGPAGMITFAQERAQDLQHIVDDGVVAEARVEGLRRRHGNRGSTSYYVNYGFDVDAAHFTGSTKLSHAAWQRLSPGMAIEVSYWRADPHVNHLGTVAQDDVDGELRTGWLVGGLLLLVFGGVLLFLERRYRRSLMLLREGEAIVGQVVGYEAFRSPKKKDKLTYRFRAPNGDEIETVAHLGRKLSPSPQPGSDVVVLQSPAEPRVFASLPQLREHAELWPDPNGM